MTEEQKLNNWIKETLSDCHVMRVESTIGGGVPDLNICRAGFECWLESKIVMHDRVLLRPMQYAWGTRRAEHMGLVRVLAWDPDKFTLYGFKFPLKVAVHGKYVAITTPPDWIGRRDKSFDLHTFLFTD